MPGRKPVLNITEYLEGVVADLCARLPEFAHINPRRVLLCAARTRARSSCGCYAKIVPMRYADGTPFRVAQGQRFALPQIPTEDGDVLYLIYVYLPRFFEQPVERRVLTLVHELYHIAPAFDGTIRKFGTRAHGASRAQYNARLQPLVDAYLAQANGSLDLLRRDFAEIARAHTLLGRTLPIPRPVRLP